MSHRAVVIGSLNMDLVVRAARLPHAGETAFGTAFLRCEGGKGANQAAAAARLGARVSMIGCVGDDDFGVQLCAALVADACDVACVTRLAGFSTGIAVILVEEGGENRIIVVSGANDAVTCAHIDAAAPVIEQARLAVLQLEIPRATVAYAITKARRAGALTLLNPAPAADLPAAMWPAIDIIVPNETEAALLTGIKIDDLPSAGHAAEALRSRGVKQVLLTLGERGVLLVAEAGTVHLPASPVTAIDTTAAGDCFIGGLTAGLCEGMTLEHAARLGIEAAGICVTRAGAQPSLPYRHELSV